MFKKIKCAYCGKKLSPKKDFIDYTNKIGFHEKCEYDERVYMLVDKIEQHLDERYILETQTINGYFVKTILSDLYKKKEVKLKLLAVYKDKDSDKILQWNIDVYNLYGTLLTSVCYSSNNEIKDIAKMYYKEMQFIEKLGRK